MTQPSRAAAPSARPMRAPDDPPTADAAKVEKPSLIALFEAEETPLLRFAWSLTRRRAVAEELVQDVFLQLHRHWEDVHNPRAWLYRSIRNRASNHLRDNRRELLSDDEEKSVGDDTADEREETPDAVVHRMEAAGHIQLILAELDDMDRQLVRLKYFEDLKYREIAERTGLSVSNVGYRLHHVLKDLAERLKQIGIEGAS